MFDVQIVIEHIKSNCPDWVNWIAASEDGKILLFSNKPEIVNNQFSDPLGTCYTIEYLDVKPWYSDWRESLVEVTKVQNYNKWIGKLCKFWHKDNPDYVIGILTEYQSNSEWDVALFCSEYICYEYCCPLTKEEALKLIAE